MPPCVRAHATLFSSSAARPHYSLTHLLSYLLSYLLAYLLTLPYLTTYSRPHAARWQVLLERYSAFLLATLSIEVDRLEQRRMAWATSPRLATAPHAPWPQPPRTASPEHRCLTLPHSASLRSPRRLPPPPHAQSRLVPPTPRVPQTGGPDLSLTSAWWVELCCCPGASRPPWLPLSTQAPDQLGVP